MMSDLPEKPRAAEVRSFNQSGYNFALTEQTSDPRRNELRIPLGLDLGRGMIRHIEVPEGWERSIGRRTRTLQDCRPPSGDVSFSIDYIGMPVGKDNAAKYKKLLAAAPHQLTHDDVAWLQKVLDANDPLKSRLSSARTYDIDYRRVLETRGHYVDDHDRPGPESEYKEFQIVYIDIEAPGLGTFLQRVCYDGASVPFHKYLKQANQLFRSMQWALELSQ